MSSLSPTAVAVGFLFLQSLLLSLLRCCLLLLLLLKADDFTLALHLVVRFLLFVCHDVLIEHARAMSI
jgi:hypothetical protein